MSRQIVGRLAATLALLSLMFVSMEALAKADKLAQENAYETWADRAAEQAKMLKKLGGDPATAERHKTKLLNDFPRAENSDLFGGLTAVTSGPRRFSVLLVARYWEAISREDVRSKSSVFHWLNAIVESKAKGGMAFDELAAYIERLNSLAEVGGAAQAGASRFVVAYQDYQLYLLQEDAVRELVLARTRKQERLLDQKRERQADSSRDYGPR